MAGNNTRIQVGLDVTANTKQAQQSIENLMGSINKLTQNATTIGSSGFKGFTAEINQAAATATQLKYNLQNAFNIDTGKLDLSKFTTSMMNSGQTLQKYKQSLVALGPEGSAAFNKLAQSIVSAEIPMRTMGPLVTKLWVSLKNVATWQISSTVLTGFISSISEAFQYAQDLNESLNNIRIVTGYSTDEMADFAREANNAAQALSTTTTAYTDASLIFYQQGLKGSDVTDRANVVIKMANVTGESAKTVSDQMTAVWNNFVDGSKSLEYYADAMTALGAATASSTDEISQGIEKFAAIGKTVGLSYEYATAALATVTAKTRQSADVVGTAFKTIFARLEQLKLGETLEDGTSLGQYSKALAAVGVDIKDINGNLKDMDTILDETAAKWKTLSQGQQVALAQSVAGVRQYSQFIALMSNWDFMEQNLEVVENSTGTLQKQADIYAESWDAAKVRVKAAAEEIYGDLLDDKFFINITSGFAKFLNIIDSVIKGMGGLRGVLSTVGSLMFMIAGPQITASLRDMLSNIWASTAIGKAAMAEQKVQAVELMQTQEIGYNQASATAVQSLERQKSATEEFGRIVSKVYQNMTAEQQKVVDERMNNIAAITSTILELDKERIKAEEVANKYKDMADAKLKAYNDNLETAANLQTDQKKNAYKQIDEEYQTGYTAIKNTSLIDNKDVADSIKQVDKLRERLDTLNKTSEQYKETKSKLAKAEQDALIQIKTVAKAEQEKNATMLGSIKTEEATIDNYKTLSNEMSAYKIVASSLVTISKNNTKSTEQQNKALEDAKKQYSIVYEELQKNGLLTGDLTNDMQALNDALSSGNIEGYNQKLQEMDQHGLEAEMSLTGMKEVIDQSGHIVQKETALIDESNIARDTMIRKSIEQRNATDNLITKSEMAAIAFQSLAGTITNLASGLMAVTQYISALKGLGSIFDDKDATTGEKIVQVISSLSMILFSITRILSAFSKTKLGDIAITAIYNKLSDKSKVKTLAEAAALKLKAKVTKQAGDESVKAAAKMYASLGIIGLILAALAALIGIITAFIKHAKQVRESQIELAKTMAENYEKTKEQVEANKELVASYQDLLEEYHKTGEGLDKVREKAEELYKTYRSQSLALALLTDNYEDYKKALEEVEQLSKNEQIKLKQDAENLQSKQGDAIVAKSIDTHAARTGLGTQRLTESLAWSAADTAVEEIAKKYDFAHINFWETYFEFDNTAEGITEAYDNFVKLRKELESSLDSKTLAKAPLYQMIVDYMNDMEETVSAYKKTREEIIQLSIDTGDQTFSKLKTEDVKTYAEYKQYAEDLAHYLQIEFKYSAEEAAEAVNKILGNSSNETLQQLNQIETILDSLTNKYKKDNNFFESLMLSDDEIKNIKLNGIKVKYASLLNEIEAQKNKYKIEYEEQWEEPYWVSNEFGSSVWSKTNVSSFKTSDEAQKLIDEVAQDNAEQITGLLYKDYEKELSNVDTIDFSGADSELINKFRQLTDGLSDEQKALIANQIHWGTITEKTLEPAIKLAKDYIEQNKEISSIQERSIGFQNIASKLKKSGMTEQDWQEIKDAIEWGQDGIVEFSTFLTMSYAEQQKYLEQSIALNKRQDLSSYDEQLQSLLATQEQLNLQLSDSEEKYNKASEAVEQYQGKLDKVFSNFTIDDVTNSDPTKRNQFIKKFTEQIKEVKNGWTEAGKSAEEFDKKISELTVWDDATKQWTLDIEAFQKWLLENNTDYQVVVNYLSDQNSLNEIKQKIDDLPEEYEIKIKVSIDEATTRIEEFSNAWTDALSKVQDGITSGFDEQGRAIHTFTSETAAALAEMDSSILQHATVTKDGKIALLDEEYNKYFDTSTGIIKVDLETRLALIKNDKEELQNSINNAKEELKLIENVKDVDKLSDDERKILEQGVTNYKKREYQRQLAAHDDALINGYNTAVAIQEGAISDFTIGAQNVVSIQGTAIDQMVANAKLLAQAMSAAMAGDTAAFEKFSSATKEFLMNGVIASEPSVEILDRSYDGEAHFMIKTRNKDGSYDIRNSNTSNYFEAIQSLHEDESEAFFSEYKQYLENSLESLEKAYANDVLYEATLQAALDNLGKAGTGDDEKTKNDKKDEFEKLSYDDKLKTIDALIDRTNDKLSDTKNNLDEVMDILSDEDMYDSPELLEKWNTALDQYNNTVDDSIALLQTKEQVISNARNSDTKALAQLIKDNYGLELNDYINKDTNTLQQSEFISALTNAKNIKLTNQNQVWSDSDKTANSEIDRLFGNIVKEDSDYYQNSRDLAAKEKERRQAYEEIAKLQAKIDTAEYQKRSKQLTNEIKRQERELKKLNRTTNKYSREADNAWGIERINALKKEADAIDNENKQIDKQIDKQKQLHSNYVQEFNDISKKYNLTELIIDENGEVVNLADAEAAITAEILRLKTIILTDDYADVKALEEQIANLEIILGLVENIAGTEDTINDLRDQQTDNQDKIKDLNYQAIIDKVNMQIQVTENELKLLDYDFEVLSSNFYTMAEAAELFLEKGEKYLDFLNIYEDGYNELEDKMQEGLIKQSDYIDGLQQMFDGLLETMGSIEDLTQQVKAYYSQVLQAGLEEIGMYTQALASSTETLNHYKNVLQLTGREADYKALGKVYEGIAKTTRNEFEAAKAEYEMLQKQADMAKEAMDAYSDDKTSKAFETLEQKWKDAENAAKQAYSEMLSSEEAYIQAAKDAYLNFIDEMNQYTERLITGDLSFDQASDALERLKNENAEYLTEGNKVYETTKLIREAQKELDKSDNAASKQKLKNFIDETAALKNKTKLSNLELEIQKAQYDILVAQMGLDEARNAKSKVRLQRNSEGGYGYVYTADEDKIADAQQKYEDAQNALYNLRLEKSAEYADKVFQLEQEGFEKLQELRELYETGAIASEEEYRQKYEEIVSYYDARILEAKELWTIAMGDANEQAAQDSWTKEFEMLEHTDEWRGTMINYIGKTAEAWKQFQEDVGEVSDLVGADADSIATKVGEIVADSNTILENTKSTVDEVEVILNKIQQIVGLYADWAQNIAGPALDQAKEVAESIAESIRQAMSELGKLDELEAMAGEEYIDVADYSREIGRLETERQNAINRGEDTTEIDKKLEYYTAKRDAKIGSNGIKTGENITDLESLQKENGVVISQSALSELRQVANDSNNPDSDIARNILATVGNNSNAYYSDPSTAEQILRIVGHYNTGGYTGSWGSEGKLAVLHEKELVLNKADTENILAAVDMVRTMANMFNIPAFGFTASSYNGETGSLEQHVHIEASFPNVTDHNEIELAFNDLINQASQYVMK